MLLNLRTYWWRDDATVLPRLACSNSSTIRSFCLLFVAPILVRIWMIFRSIRYQVRGTVGFRAEQKISGK